jgi:hypothetical protein
MCSEVSPVITFIFNQSRSIGDLRKEWLQANIFALHKKGPRNVTENYHHPI